MNTYIIGMCDSDFTYMKRLAEYFMHKSKLAVQIMIFSETQHLINYLSDHTLDLLITGGDVNLEKFTEWFGVIESTDFTGSGEVVRSISWGIQLCDAAVADERLNDKMFKISRYRSSAELLSFVQKLLLKRSGQEQTDSHDTQEFGIAKGFTKQKSISKEIQERENNTSGSCVIGVYAPVQRCGKTSLSVLMTRYLSKEYRTLFITMDQYTQLFSDAENNLAELIFKMCGNTQLRLGKKQEWDFAPYQNFVKQWEGMSYIAVPDQEDLVQISGKQILGIIELLKYGSSYDYVVMDLGRTLEDVYEILNACEYIFVPCLDDCISKKKQQMFEQWVKKQDTIKEGNILNRLHRISMPGVIDTDSEENYYKELRWSNFGRAVGELLQQYKIG